MMLLSSEVAAQLSLPGAVSTPRIQALTSFKDNGLDFTQNQHGLVPTEKLWVNNGARIVDGMIFTNNPPPPQRDFPALNDTMIPVNTPVIQLSRKIFGVEPSTYPGGAELISKPIDLRTAHKAMLYFFYHRARKHDDYARDWSDSVMLGPEARVIRNGNPNDEAADRTGAMAADELQTDFACTTDDGMRNIFDSAAATEVHWSIHPRAGGKSAITNNPALTIFGGGGQRRGYDEVSIDSALSRGEGLRSDVFDDGKDSEWKFASVMIPDTFLHAPNGASANFRFRFKVAANNHGRAGGPKDDDDEFYIKNVELVTTDSMPHVQLFSTSLMWPYRATPASMLEGIPVYARIVNTGLQFADAFIIRAQAFLGNGTTNSIYYHSVTVPFLQPAKSFLIPLPSCSLFRIPQTSWTSATVLLTTSCKYPGNTGTDPLDDSTASTSVFSIDNGLSYFDSRVVSDVWKDTKALLGQSISSLGLSLETHPSPLFNAESAFGDVGGSGSGQIAVNYSLPKLAPPFVYNLRGYQAYFVNTPIGLDNVRFSLYENDSISNLPGTRVDGSLLKKIAGFDDMQLREIYDSLSTYLYEEPLRLNGGSYWMSCAQLSSISFNLGATASQAGFQILNVDDTGTGGKGNINVYMDGSKRVTSRSGHLVNDTLFAYQNGYPSGSWEQLHPLVGNVAYAHNDFKGKVGTTETYSRGSFIPLLRPIIEMVLDTASTDVDDNSKSDDSGKQTLSRSSSVQINSSSPQPADHELTINYTLTHASQISMEISDLFGRHVAFVAVGEQAEGSHCLHFNFDKSDVDLSDGMYCLRLTRSDGYTDAMTFLVAR